jgi:hypothetical protein
LKRDEGNEGESEEEENNYPSYAIVENPNAQFLSAEKDSLEGDRDESDEEQPAQNVTDSGKKQNR